MLTNKGQPLDIDAELIDVLRHRVGKDERAATTHDWFKAAVLTLRNQEFVEAATALGADSRRVMFVHILPNSVSVIAVFTTLAVSGALMGESALSFLGVGVQPPTATWGNMLADARDLFSILQYWWLTWFPALAIFTTVLATNFVGDGVRDALDPKEQKR